MISTMLPCSVVAGAKSISRPIVAALINRIVTIGVRKMAISRWAAASASAFGNGQMAGDDHARDMLFAELQTTGLLFGFRQTLQIARFRISKDLNTFTRKIGKKTGKRQDQDG